MFVKKNCFSLPKYSVLGYPLESLMYYRKKLVVVSMNTKHYKFLNLKGELFTPKISRIFTACV